MDVETIKKNFYDLRREKGLTWADIAAAAGVNDYHKITNLLNSSGLTLSTLERLSALVGVEPWQLLKPQDEHTNTTGQAAPIMCPYCGKPLILTVSIPETNEDTTNPEK